MERGAAPDRCADPVERWLGLDQQVSGRGPHEHLDPRRAFQALELGDVVHIVMCRADVEGEVAEHAVASAANLVRECVRAGRRWPRVRHLENGCDAAKRGGAASGFEVLLLLQSGLAEVNLGVDDAWQNVQAGAVNHLAPGLGWEGTKSSDATVADADVTLADAVVIDDGAALQHQIECLGHACASVRLPRCAAPLTYLAVSAPELPVLHFVPGCKDRD